MKVKVRLRRAAGGPRSGALRVRLLRRGKTIAVARLQFGRGSGDAPADPNSLQGRLFWDDDDTLYFTGPEFVSFNGISGSWPTCTAASENCKRYTYDAASNTLTIDGAPASLNPPQTAGDWNTIKIGDKSYGELAFPEPGTRLDGKWLLASGDVSYGSGSVSMLQLLADGRFVTGGFVTTGPNVPGGGFTEVAPQNKGTYEFRADRTLALSFADGTQGVLTVAQFGGDNLADGPIFLNGTYWLNDKDR